MFIFVLNLFIEKKKNKILGIIKILLDYPKI